MKKFICTLTLITVHYLAGAQPSDPGFQHLYYERYLSAAEHFRNTLQKDPGNGEAWLGLTQALLESDAKQAAANALYNAPASVKNDPFFMAAYGTMLLQQQKEDSAAYYFNNSLQETKEKNVDILSAVARAHATAKNGNGTYAVELVNKALKRDKDNAALHSLLGDAYRKAGNGSEAYKAYKKALELNSGYARAYHRIGEIFLSQKNSELYLEYFTRAANADPRYAPALYQLYSHYFYYDAAKALQYYNDYASKSDVTLQTEYDRTDLYYLSKDYQKAIDHAGSLLAKQGDQTKPRLYKLLSYSHAELRDTAKAIDHMQQYFAREADSNLIAKDFETMALLYASGTKADSAMYFFNRAAALQKDSTALFAFYKKMSDRAAAQKDYAAQAKWMGSYYNGNARATNVDLFNWALANYRAEDYVMADSVFGLYVAKYPEQSFGYYWQARANTARDQEMKEGLAVPHYQKLIEILKTDTANTNYKKWMIEALGYLAAYEANTQKDYKEAVGYFEQVLEIDPANAEAKRYINLLQEDNEKKDGR